VTILAPTRPMGAATSTGGSRGPGLKARALGFPSVLAQSIALISPTMTAVLIIPLAFGDAGQGTWLAYAFGTVMLLFVVLCLNQFARRSALPGSMYGYTTKGLGPVGGVMSGWSLIWSSCSSAWPASPASRSSPVSWSPPWGSTRRCHR
jgi:amino acid transporter